MQRIARGKMGLARFLGPRLGFAQCRALRFQFGHGTLDFQCDALPFGLGLALLQQPQHLLALHHLFVQRVVAARHLGLRFQPLHLAAKFQADVFDPCQIFPRVFESTVRFLASLLVAGDAGRFFKKDAQIIRLGLDDP